MKSFSKIVFSKSFVRTALFHDSNVASEHNKTSKTLAFRLGKARIPKFFKPYIIPLYFRLLGKDDSFFDVSFYNSMSEVFRQPVTSSSYFNNLYRDMGFRNTPTYHVWKKSSEQRVLGSPVEGYILHFGKTNQNATPNNFSVKSTSICIEDIIAPKSKTLNFKQGKRNKPLNYIVMYLSPSNYHRFHAPTDLTLNNIYQTSGKLRPMKSVLTHIKEKLFDNQSVDNFSEISLTENRKLSMEGKSNYGAFNVCAIGSSRVGCINLNCPVSKDGKSNNELRYATDRVVYQKGDELGHFDLGGSAIVIAFESEGFQFDNIKENMKLELGQRIGVFN